MLSVHNDQLADYLAPRLTTVSMPTKRPGAEAVELALVLTAGGTARRVVVPDTPKLIGRDSTARPARPYPRESPEYYPDPTLDQRHLAGHEVVRTGKRRTVDRGRILC